MKTVSVLLAAGFGTRMKSDLPKVLHPVAGRPMINWCVACAEGVSDLRPIVVVGHGRGQVIHALGDRCTYAVQDELLGTAHALQQALPRLQAEDNPADPVDTIIVTYGDMPLLRKETLGALVRAYAARRGRCRICHAHRYAGRAAGIRADCARPQRRHRRDCRRGGLHACTAAHSRTQPRHLLL